jgi:hypothetical protein
MYSEEVIETDVFYNLSFEAQSLYLHYNQNADDDGFVRNPKQIRLLGGFNEDAYEELLENHFLIAFKNVVLVKHWLVNNDIKKDRYTPTLFIDEKMHLKVANNIYIKCDEIQDIKTELPLNRQYWGKDDENEKNKKNEKNGKITQYQNKNNSFNRGIEKSNEPLYCDEDAIIANSNKIR